jgi:hypothetical protein
VTLAACKRTKNNRAQRAPAFDSAEVRFGQDDRLLRVNEKREKWRSRL